MGLPEEAFIVRFWMEPGEAQGERPHYRGVIGHVASGRRHYLEDLNQIT